MDFHNIIQDHSTRGVPMERLFLPVNFATHQLLIWEQFQKQTSQTRFIVFQNTYNRYTLPLQIKPTPTA